MQKDPALIGYILTIVAWVWTGLRLLPTAFAAQPVIYPVATAAGVTAAYVQWETDTATDSRVDYGTTNAYGASVTDISAGTYHLLRITELAAGATYHYRVTSSGVSSPDYTFTTYADPTGIVRTVGAGKTYSTIQACANAANAGDTCLVYAGTYNETVTPARSGNSSSPITFLAQEAAAVSGFNISNRTYISIKGFEIDNPSSAGITANSADHASIENNYLHPSGGNGIRISDGSPANDVAIRKNIIYHCGWGSGGSGSEGIYAFGDRILIENNDISHGADFNFIGGSNMVVRNNVWHHASHDELPGSNEHIDGFQVSGATLNYSLVEGNTEWMCTDSTGNCHFGIVRNQTAPAADNIVVRYNFAYHLDGSGMSFGGLNDNVPNGRFYNNTMATEAVPAENGDGVSFQNAAGGKIINNIFYNAAAGGWSPHYGAAYANNNIGYTSGYSGEWNSPYSGEATYATLRNQNPGFTNYPAGSAISSASPAKDGGMAPTTVAASDAGSGTSLAVADARFFQPGWAGAQGDWIAVGIVSNIAQISAIDYGTNTLTLANNIARSSGQPVWLYKKSDGERVLYDAAPDIGGYEYGSGSIPPPTPSAPSPPKNVRMR